MPKCVRKHEVRLWLRLGQSEDDISRLFSCPRQNVPSTFCANRNTKSKGHNWCKTSFFKRIYTTSTAPWWLDWRHPTSQCTEVSCWNLGQDNLLFCHLPKRESGSTRSPTNFVIRQVLARYGSAAPEIVINIKGKDRGEKTEWPPLCLVTTDRAPPKQNAGDYHV